MQVPKFLLNSQRKTNRIFKCLLRHSKRNGYTLLRTTIQSSDFSSASYSYIEEGDKDLKTFSIEMIGISHSAYKASHQNHRRKLVTYATPWSPNAFMKSKKMYSKRNAAS